MSVGTVCSRIVVTVAPAETIRAAAMRMAEYDVGTVVVVEGDGSNRAVGILTDRDVAVRAVARGLDPDATPVAQVMTAPVQSVNEYTPLDEALGRMVSAATRRLIVSGDGGSLAGILSLDDVLEHLAEEVRSVGRVIEKQQPHVPA